MGGPDARDFMRSVHCSRAHRRHGGRAYGRSPNPPSSSPPGGASSFDGEGEGAADGKLAADRGPHLALAHRPTDGLDLATQVENVAGPDDALEADVVDTGEERELAAV